MKKKNNKKNKKKEEEEQEITRMKKRKMRRRSGRGMRKSAIERKNERINEDKKEEIGRAHV